MPAIARRNGTMTLTEITNIILDVAENTRHGIRLAIQVMELLKNGLTVETDTRDLQDALLVQQIVGKIRDKEC